MALKVTVESNFLQLKALLDGTARQIPFALKVAINDTAKDFQKVQTRQIMKVFTIRRATFAKRAVKIKPFATKQNLEAKVSIDPPGGQARADIFAKFETPSIKTPREGQHLAIPSDVPRYLRRTRSRPSPLKTLKLRRVGRTIRGERRTFVIPGVGVFQRTGRRLKRRIRRRVRAVGNKLRLLFKFARRARIDDRLQFVDTAKKVVKDTFPGHMHKSFEHAMATTRRKR